MKVKKTSLNPGPDALISDSGKLKVFISWSGSRSKYIAEALRGWLPLVIQSLDPWISSGDIPKGARGLSDVARELEHSSVGIVCLTPENQAEPWILFEAGALSKLGDSRLCTYLLDLEPGDVRKPLGLFQHTKMTKDETLRLMLSVNDAAGPRGLTEAQVKEIFEICWPNLEKKLANIPPATKATPSTRTDSDKIDEILSTVRDLSRKRDPRFVRDASTLSEEMRRARELVRRALEQRPVTGKPLDKGVEAVIENLWRKTDEPSDNESSLNLKSELEDEPD